MALFHLSEHLTIHNMTEARSMLAITLSVLIISVRLKEAILLLYHQQHWNNVPLNWILENQTPLSPYQLTYLWMVFFWRWTLSKSHLWCCLISAWLLTLSITTFRWRNLKRTLECVVLRSTGFLHISIIDANKSVLMDCLWCTSGVLFRSSTICYVHFYAVQGNWTSSPQGSLSCRWYPAMRGFQARWC